MLVEEWIYQKLLREYQEQQVFDIPFYQVTSPRFRIVSQEMRPYDIPITTVLSDELILVFDEFAELFKNGDVK